MFPLPTLDVEWGSMSYVGWVTGMWNFLKNLMALTLNIFLLALPATTLQLLHIFSDFPSKWQRKTHSHTLFASFWKLFTNNKCVAKNICYATFVARDFKHITKNWTHSTLKVKSCMYTTPNEAQYCYSMNSILQCTWVANLMHKVYIRRKFHLCKQNFCKNSVCLQRSVFWSLM